MRPMQTLIGGKLRPVMPDRTLGPLDPTTALDQIRSFASVAQVLEVASPGECMGGRTSMVRRVPITVGAQVTPWNSPRMVALRRCRRAIALGNTIATDQGPLREGDQHDRVTGSLEDDSMSSLEDHTCIEHTSEPSV